MVQPKLATLIRLDVGVKESLVRDVVDILILEWSSDSLLFENNGNLCCFNSVFFQTQTDLANLPNFPSKLGNFA